MRTLKFRIAYQHEETGSITFRSIELGDTIPCVSERWYVIGKDQYIGLKDKHGTEVYEGDIVKGTLRYHIDHPIQIVAVVYDENMVLHPFHDEAAYSIGDYWKEGLVDGFEVIGNVYEHPELLDT